MSLRRIDAAAASGSHKWALAVALATSPCTVESSGAGETSSATTDTADGTSLLPGPTVCQPSCSVVGDCCPPAEDLPPGVTCPGDCPLNVTCSDAGICGVDACTSDDDCSGGLQLRCIGTGSTARCLLGCEVDADCFSPTRTCSGEVDGVTFCVSSEDPFACDDDAECEESGFGRCIDGRCGCESSADCTDGWRCPPS